MFNILRAGANTLAQAAQEVAQELQQPSAVQKTKKIEEDGEAIYFGSEGRIVLCGFPDRAIADEVYRVDRSLRPYSSPTKLKYDLTTRFGSDSMNFLVWNLSGKKYAYDELDGKIIEYDFPSRPIMPFDALVEVVNAMHSWVTSKANNVAIVHDISGRRAAVVVACVLEILEYYPKNQALRAVTNEMGKSGNALVASQIRYYEYFCEFRKQPSLIQSGKTLRLDRIIVNGVPDFTYDAKLTSPSGEASCVPRLRIFDVKGDEINSSIPPNVPFKRKELSFSIVPSKPVFLTKDVMLRFFHQKPEGSEMSMFGIALNIDFVNDIVLRFTFSELDGTAKNPRFVKDMFVDMILSESLEANPIQIVNTSNESKPEVESTQQDTATVEDTGVQQKRESDIVGTDIQTDETVPGVSTSTEKEQDSTETQGITKHSSENNDSVLREIEAALGDDDSFAMEDFEISELEDLKL